MKGPIGQPVHRAGLASAVARHPAARGMRPDAIALALRCQERLSIAGVPEPSIGAAASATRGLWGVDLGSFARRIGVTTEVARALEGGTVRADAVPGTLLTSAPFAELLARLGGL